MKSKHKKCKHGINAGFCVDCYFEWEEHEEARKPLE